MKELQSNTEYEKPAILVMEIEAESIIRTSVEEEHDDSTISGGFGEPGPWD